MEFKESSLLAFVMKNRHFGGECSWVLAGKARRCGKFWVFACVPNPGKLSIWRQCPPSARKESTKKLPNRSVFTHVLFFSKKGGAVPAVLGSFLAFFGEAPHVEPKEMEPRPPPPPREVGEHPWVVVGTDLPHEENVG